MSSSTGQGQLSDDTLRTLLDIAPDAIAIVRGGTVLYMSPTGARMLGYANAHDVIGIDMTVWLHPDDVAVAAQRIGEVMRSGKPHDLPHVYRARRLNGDVFLAEVASVPISYEGGPALLSFVRDVTERKALEGRLAEAERLAALGRLSAGVAHELNNPLTHLVLAVTRLRQLCDSIAPENAAEVVAEARSKLAYMNDDVERMMVIARELRLFSSPQPTSREPVDLRDVLEHALRTVEETVPGHGIRIERRHDEEVGPADADPSRLVQVFVNLVRNAFESLREAASGRPPTLTLALRAVGDDRVAAEVADNGPGIPPDMRERVFEPFFTTKRYGTGAGLGLAISRSLVQALGGTLEVASDPGGTTFTVTLPRWRRSAPIEVPPRPRTGRLRVLVIDDEISIGRTIDSIFEDQHDVVVTTSARDALAQLEQGLAFDVILCDVVMPGASGVDFYDQLRVLRPELCERVIFMTGATLGSDQGRSLAALPNAVLEKPFDLDRLEAMLAAAAASAQ